MTRRRVDLLPLRPLLPLLAVLACAPTYGDPSPVDAPAVALRADAGVEPAAAAAALREAGPRVALVAGPADDDWFAEVAAAAGLTPTTRPGTVRDGLGLTFMGLEALGDTTHQLTYEGGSLLLHDALYDLGDRRYLDLLAFEVESPAAARPAISALTAYIATDVPAGAAVIIAVAVPGPEVADSVGRLLSPAYRGATHCNAEAEAVAGIGIRLYYGPEARIFCRDADAAATDGGERIRAGLVVGRRR